jgi:predicted ester cyclase
MSIKDFAEKFIKAEDEAWQKGNFNALEALEDPNVVYHMVEFGDLMGFEAHKQNILTSRQAGSGLRQEWKYLTGEGNLFALSYKSRFMFTGEVPGMPPPTGKEVTSDSLFLFRLKNGKIVEAWRNGSITGLDLSALSGK